MPSEVTKILEFNQYQKSDKALFIIYAECLIDKIDGCKNNPEKSLTKKVSEHIPSGFSVSAVSKNIGNRCDVYRGKYCIKRFCKSLKEYTAKITNFKKKKTMLITKEQQESFIFAKKNLKINIWKIKYPKVRDHCHYTGEYRG